MLQGFNPEAFDYIDGRGQYPEEIKARAPRGSRAMIRRAAQSEGVTLGEFIRRAVRQRIEALQGGSDLSHAA